LGLAGQRVVGEDPRRRRLVGETLAPLLFAVLALAFVGPALLPGRALLPIDGLFGYPPWQAHAAEFGISLPHNSLIADAILQNYSWKQLARDSVAAGRAPLWNPYILAGQPFLASGQNGALYPLGVLFYLLPLTQAYGWFIALHLWIGAMGAWWLARTLGATRTGGIIAGLTFAFCGYLTVSYLWPMVVSTAVWLPALLATIEGQMQGGARRATRTLLIGSVIVGLQFLAGHLEMSLYLLLTAGLYTALRLAGHLRAEPVRRLLLDGAVALALVVLGTGLAAIQLVPFAEVIGHNVRSGWSDYDETISYALPKERLLAYLVPNLFGNPTDHTYVDLESWQTRPVDHQRPNGEPRTDTEWSGKNYVEGTVYVGILPLLLAAVAVLARPRGGALTLTIVAVVALLLAFGSPLYAVLFYGIPGVNQLHTPFRWVYPFSLCVAVLAGLGARALPGSPQHAGETPPPSPLQHPPRGPSTSWDPRVIAMERGSTARSFWERTWARAPGAIGGISAVIGFVGLAMLAAAFVSPGGAVALADRALRRWPELRDGFGTGAHAAEMLFSYQWRNLAVAAGLLAASGVVLWLGARGRLRLAGPIAVALIVVDLFIFGVGFNTVADTAPLSYVPPSIQAIQADPGLFRIVTYGEDDTLPSNTNMLFGLQDVRGYDTIILREYMEYLESIEPQRGIPYSKVAKLFEQRSLQSPLLDLLNVKYVLTSKAIPQVGWTLLTEADGVRVYQRQQPMPRAFVVSSYRGVADREAALGAIREPGFDPRTDAIVEGAVTPPGRGSGEPYVSADVVEYRDEQVVVRTQVLESPGLLVLTDVMFPDWTATVDGAPATVLRTDALFRGVELSPGAHTVVFAYRPLSFRVGALLSAISLAMLLSLGGLSLFTRRSGPAAGLSAAQRVAHNSAFPMGASLLNKAVDLGFALIVFRVLQAEGVGAYTFAGVLVAYYDIVVGYGLATLITRDVAREPGQAGRYLGNATVLRLIFWLGAVGVTALLVGPLSPALNIEPPLALAIWLLVIGLLPGLLSGVLSALFMAQERMDLPAAVTVFSTISKVVLGLVALLSGWGYVGLAGVSIVTNLATLALLAILYGVLIGWPRPSVDARLLRLLLIVSFPLMINSLLNQLFFKIDVLLLKPLAGDLELGWYSTAYKLIDGLQVIPSSFVLALFPLLARHANGDRVGMAALTRSGIRVLLLIAFPVAVGTTALADGLIVLIAGQSYLPQSAQALQILIWYLPLSFVNGLLQYVLIAVNRQRTLTIAFVIGVIFNLGANLALIPIWGYVGAALVTVASEAVLMAPFLWIARREIGSIGLLGVAWRPALAAAIMAFPVWDVGTWSPLLAIPIGAVTYGVVLLALRTFSRAELTQLRSLLIR
jgi:O-antigen/teichoic acid export membrane protein